MMNPTAAARRMSPRATRPGTSTRRPVLAGALGWAAFSAALVGCTDSRAGADRHELGATPTAGSPASTAVASTGTVPSATRSGFVPVPGARLYYQLRGAGPLLLIVQGGAGDADAAPEVVDHLANHYT